MSNFKFLLSDPGVAAFAEVAMAAEKILHIDPAAYSFSEPVRKTE